MSMRTMERSPLRGILKLSGCRAASDATSEEERLSAGETWIAEGAVRPKPEHHPRYGSSRRRHDEAAGR